MASRVPSFAAAFMSAAAIPRALQVSGVLVAIYILAVAPGPSGADPSRG